MSDASFFCVLAGAWKHENGSVRDVRGWHERGWCRMEMLANALSPKQKPLIVAENPSVIPVDSLEEAVALFRATFHGEVSAQLFWSSA